MHWLSSAAVGGIVEFMSDEFRQRWHKNVKVGQGLRASAALCYVRAWWHPLRGAGAAAEQSEVGQPATHLVGWLFPCWSSSVCPADVF